MKTTAIFATLFAALVAASPVELQQRQSTTIRVQMSDDATDTAVQAEIPKTGAKISISSKFGNLGSGVPATRAFVVSGSGSCDIFRDNGNAKVATIRSGGNDVTFARVNLGNGVIVCK